MVTDTLPEAPVPITAVMPVVESTTNDLAAIPPKLTSVVPLKFEPLMFTMVPLVPPIGVNEVTIGPV